MNKYLLLFIIQILISNIALSFSGKGAGTIKDPFQITNVYQLQNINTITSANYIIMNDIDASVTSTWNDGAGFIPIGNFFGSLNGKGYVVSYLHINRPNEIHVGLFKNMSGAYINNLGLVNVNIRGHSSVGGFCGNSYLSTITNCYAEGIVSGVSSVGGFCGYNHKSTISFSHSSGNVFGTSNFIGGFCGYNYGGEISNSCSNSSVIGNSKVGGFCGINTSSAKVNNCYSKGSVSGDSWIGGFYAENHAPSVTTNCFSTGSVSGNYYLGGFCATNNSVLSSCYWDSETSGIGTSYGGTGKTTDQMKQQATFINWNFSDIWKIKENSTCPDFFDINSLYSLPEWTPIYAGLLILGLVVYFFMRRKV